MSIVDQVLIGWSALATMWWFIAIGLIRSAVRCRLPHSARVYPRETEPKLDWTLTVFKPLPTISYEQERVAIAAAVESFVGQLRDGDEMLIGVPESQKSDWLSVWERWRQQYPKAQVQVVVRDPPHQHANPKVSWMEHLAKAARGRLWLWSDADVNAPSGYLERIRAELASGTTDAVTSPYWIRRITTPAAMVDALFVNAEFLPGALLLRQLGTVRLAFGAGILFRAEDFRTKLDWRELGECLADDYLLGQRLGPVTIGTQLVETCSLETRFSGALRHLYRWQKTIRWCRPGSFAALIFVLPILGWLGRCAVGPQDKWAWIGLGILYGVELTALAVLTTLISPRLWLRGYGVWLLWPLLRAVGWLAAWLPLQVIWQDPKSPWRALRQRR